MLFAYQVIVSQCVHGLYQRIYSFLFADNADMIIDAGTHEVIFLHHSAGKNACLNLFAFSVSDSETDGWIFMFVAHGNAPFVLNVAVAAGVMVQPDSHRKFILSNVKSRLYHADGWYIGSKYCY